jgi:hypothetical protein
MQAVLTQMHSAQFTHLPTLGGNYAGSPALLQAKRGLKIIEKTIFSQGEGSIKHEEQ